ncbi:MAG: hypothetical protein AB1422_11605 [bacterium]
MSQKLIEQITKFDDFQVTRFFNHFSRKIFSGLEEGEGELIGLVPAEIKGSKELSPIFKLSSDEKGKTLDAKDASDCARNILLAMAQQPGLEKILAEELKTYKDDDMFAGIILAVGTAAAMILFAATIKGEATYKDGKWKIRIGKESASIELVEKILNPLAKAAGKLTGLGG